MYLGAFSTRFPDKLVSDIVMFGAVPEVVYIEKSEYLLSMKLTVAKASKFP